MKTRKCACKPQSCYGKLWTYYTMCTLQDMDLNQELNQRDGGARYHYMSYVTGHDNLAH